MDVRAVLVVLILAGACSGEGDRVAGFERPVEWHLMEAPGDSLEVEALFGGSTCNDFRRWEVDQSATQVKVEGIVFSRRVTGCVEDQVSEVHTVRLTEPLGDRELVGCSPGDPGAECTVVDRLRPQL